MGNTFTLPGKIRHFFITYTVDNGKYVGEHSEFIIIHSEQSPELRDVIIENWPFLWEGADDEEERIQELVDEYMQTGWIEIDEWSSVKDIRASLASDEENAILEQFLFRYDPNQKVIK